MTITFIHAADIHLDRPFLGLNECAQAMQKRVRKSPFTALSRLVQTAISRKVDFVLLAGDIFDSQDRGLRAETRLRGYMKQLAEGGIDVFMIHGNHDPLDGHWSGLTYGDNVHVFGPTPEVYRYQKPGGPSVNIYGFSYGSQHVPENMIDLYQKEPGSDYHVAMLHGSIKGDAIHDVYAPFTVSELLNKGMDYWALGHIHKGEILHEDPPVIYPGSLQGLSVKETGDKGFYVVTLDHEQVRKEFVKVSDIIWENAVLDITGIHSFEKLVQAAEDLKEHKRKAQEGVLFRLKIIGQAPSDLAADGTLFMNLLEVLRTGEEERRDFVWCMDIEDEAMPAFHLDKLRNSPHFIGDVVRLIEQKDSVKEDLSALYNHQQAKKYLFPLSEEMQKALIKDAEKLLLTGLHKMGADAKVFETDVISQNAEIRGVFSKAK